MRTGRERAYIRSHTGLRGLAASFVVAYHLQFGQGPKLWIETATEIFSRSYLFVDLFFVLSGFIISYTSLGGSRIFNFSEYFSFMRTRIARIYPLHIFCLFYLMFFMLMLLAFNWATDRPIDSLRWSVDGMLAFLMEILLLNAWNVPHEISWNVPSWSISAEMVAYVLFPLLTVFAARSWGLTTIIVGSVLFYLYVGSVSGDLDITAGLAPLRCMAGFAIGMALYYKRDIFAALSARAASIYQGVAVGAILVLLAMPANDVLIILRFALLVGTTWTDKGVIAAALSARPVTYLGEISYSIYLNHVCLGQILHEGWARLLKHIDGVPPDVQRVAWIGLVFVSTLIVSALTHRYIEKPGRAFIMRRQKKRQDGIPVASS